MSGLKHQKEKRSMEHFAGLDLSVKETSVCIVDDTGKIVREVGERACSVAGSVEEPRLPLQANWVGSWTAGNLCRDAAHESSRDRRNCNSARRCRGNCGSTKFPCRRSPSWWRGLLFLQMRRPIIDVVCVLVDDHATGRARSCRCATAAAEFPATAGSSRLLKPPRTSGSRPDHPKQAPRLWRQAACAGRDR